MKKKRAFIFGITGQDGSYLAKFLIKKYLQSVTQDLLKEKFKKSYYSQYS